MFAPDALIPFCRGIHVLSLSMAFSVETLSNVAAGDVQLGKQTGLLMRKIHAENTSQLEDDCEDFWVECVGILSVISSASLMLEKSFSESSE